MESTNKPAQQQENSAESRTLQIDFTWKNWKSLISEKDDQQSKPIYVVDYKTFKPHLIFKSAVDDSTIGSGTLHAISINAECDVHGKPIKLSALKRFKTEYTHLSYAFSNTESPVPMTWTSTSDFKNWDFICLDEQQIPVAKFSAHVWALKKLGNIEFLGPKAVSDAARDEIVITGTTLFYCMLLRSTNILSLFGAMFHRPGHDDKEISKIGSDDNETRQVSLDSKGSGGTM
jgi:hypothetical protein